MIINQFFLWAKFYIYRCKLDEINLCINLFTAKERATYNLELFIASLKTLHSNGNHIFLSFLEPRFS